MWLWHSPILLVIANTAYWHGKRAGDACACLYIISRPAHQPITRLCSPQLHSAQIPLNSSSTPPPHSCHPTSPAPGLVALGKDREERGGKRENRGAWLQVLLLQSTCTILPAFPSLLGSQSIPGGVVPHCPPPPTIPWADVPSAPTSHHRGGVCVCVMGSCDASLVPYTGTRQTYFHMTSSITRRDGERERQKAML